MMYFDFRACRAIANHRVLAIDRGERRALKVKISVIG